MPKFLVLTLIGYLCYTVMDFIVQYLSQVHSLFQVVWINASVAFLVALVLFPLFFGRKSIEIKRLKIHLIRGVFVIGMDLSAFYSYTENSISAAYSLILTAPLLASLLSIRFEKIRFTPMMWGLALTAFTGVIIVMDPDYGQVKISLFFALISALLEGITIIIYRLKGQQESAISFVLSGNLMVSICLLPFVLLHYQSMSLYHLSLNICSGFFLALATGLVLYVLRLREVILVGTLQYSQILWSILINYLLFYSLPQFNVIVGCILITVANITLIRIMSKQQRMGNHLTKV